MQLAEIGLVLHWSADIMNEKKVKNVQSLN